MATSFLNSADKIWFQNAVDTWFETFKESIIVHKEPIKILQNNSNQMAGYKDDSNANDYVYAPRYQSFKAVIKYNPTDNLIENDEIKIKFINHTIEIYVKEDAKNYIDKDRTEKITFNDKNFNVFSTSIVKTYGDISYYMYYLKETR
jgi:hypothetical protein